MLPLQSFDRTLWHWKWLLFRDKDKGGYLNLYCVVPFEKYKIMHSIVAQEVGYSDFFENWGCNDFYIIHKNTVWCNTKKRDKYCFSMEYSGYLVEQGSLERNLKEMLHLQCFSSAFTWMALRHYSVAIESQNHSFLF